MPRAHKRQRPADMPDPLSKKKIRVDEEGMPIKLEMSVTNDPPIIKEKTKRKALDIRRELKAEILDVYNQVTGKNLKKFGDIHDPYTMVEAYLLTETGQLKGLRYGHFAAIFNDKISSARRSWMKQFDEIDDDLAQKWDISTIQSRTDIEAALAVVFVMKHCFDSETRTFFVNPLNFSELRENTKYEVIRLLKVWGVDGVDVLEDYMSYPKFLDSMTTYAGEMHQIGVSSITLNFDTKGLMERKLNK